MKSMRKHQEIIHGGGPTSASAIVACRTRWRTSSAGGTTARLCRFTSFISCTSFSTCFFLSAIAPSSSVTSPFSLSCALFAWSALCTARSISTCSLSTSHIRARSNSCCRFGSYCRLYLRCSTSISSISSRILFLHCSSSVSQLASFERSSVISDLSVFSCCRTSSLSSSTYWYACSWSPVCRNWASVLLISCAIASSWSVCSRLRLSR
uniref:Uncharacterized protein n=1 Tax=Anopheles coluzzii TaxID=1518534 RepID=A0A8W7PMG2_ANOCL